MWAWRPRPRHVGSTRLSCATATREDDLLGEPGPLTHLRSITRLKLRGAYGRWLWHLTVTDSALLASPPAARITRDAGWPARRGLSARNASLTVAHRVLDLERAAKAFAPAGDWRWLRKLVNKLCRRAHPVRDKRARMRPPREVFDAGLALMVQAETGMFTSAKKQALAFRDGLLLALLASRAPRVGNVAMMDIQRHLERSGEVRILRFDGAEMKNGSPFEVPLPRELTAPLERFPALASCAPGRSSSDQPGVDLGVRTAAPRRRDPLHRDPAYRTLRVSLHPHLLRTGLMTETAIRDPEHVGIASTL